jgi:hypothetical protein
VRGQDCPLRRCWKRPHLGVCVWRLARAEPTSLALDYFNAAASRVLGIDLHAPPGREIFKVIPGISSGRWVGGSGTASGGPRPRG